MDNFDFSGWATRVNRKCSDGRTIMRDAFKHNDGQKVPLVWSHQHNEPDMVLGYALLENRPDGVYTYGKFNDTDNGQLAKRLVQHGDVGHLSIYANQLKENMSHVVHGNIREVSLVLAGANPGAYIDYVVAHGAESEDEAYIYNDDKDGIVLYHSDNHYLPEKENRTMDENMTVEEILDSMTPEQREFVSVLMDRVEDDAYSDGYEDASDDYEDAIDEELGDDYDDEDFDDEDFDDEDYDEGEEDMKHNVFDNDYEGSALMHSDLDFDAVMSDAKQMGSMRDAVLAHSDGYGITNVDFLFPEAHNLTDTPEFIKRTPDAWVDIVMNGVHHTPFSRIKSMFADITEDEARAKGYIKGKLKKEEVFSLLKRSTTATTVYKKQKMDRDDTIEITDFDVISWIKREMRIMLNEEIARAILVGDGRLNSDDDKISEDHIRPIVNEADLFALRWGVAAGANTEELAKNFIKAAIKSRKGYRGSGSPIMFTTEDMLTEMLLLEDGIGHRLYKTEAELATAMRVSRIVPVSVMENLTDKDGRNVYAIIVNLNDYNVGADKGGSINMFDDFDINYNQMLYLMETRISGALTKPFSAIILRAPASDSAAGNESPTASEAMAPYKA